MEHRPFFEKLTGSQLAKNFPAFYGTPISITAFTRAGQLSLTWARSIQSMPPYSTSRIQCLPGIFHGVKATWAWILPSRD